MQIEPSLLEILACPKCHAALQPDETDDTSSVLVCTGCGLRYPVRDDIPVLLIDEASQGPVPAPGSTGP